MNFAVKTMDYKHRNRTKLNPLLKSKNNLKCVFKPRRSFKDVIAHLLPWLRFSVQTKPPFEIKGHNFTIEYGLSPKPHSAPSGWRYRLNSKIVMIVTLSSLLPLAWWLNQSDASIGQLPNPSTGFQAPTSVSLSEADASIGQLPNPSTGFQAPTRVSLSEAPVSTLEAVRVNLPTRIPKSPVLPWLHLRIKSGETLSQIFKRYQLNKTQLYQMIQLPEYAKPLRQLHLNQALHIRHDAQGNIEDLILVLNKIDELHIYKDDNEDNEFTGEMRPIGMRSETVSAHGIVKNSLSEAAKQAGLSDKLLTHLAEIFSWEMDFDRDIYPGDQFSVIYKRYQIEGDIEEGDILAAEVINLGKVYRALRYTDQTGYIGYYTPEGDSLQKLPLIRAPVQYTRISSPFGTRMHPILGRYNFHTGTDYAASTGTPIIAAADATVKFVGRKGGYGKTIVLEHNKRVRTLYAHLYKFAEELRAEQAVFQGQIIGYVGQSGRATGPHLHYEIQLDGRPQNPQKIALPLILPLLEEKQAHFAKKTQKLISKLDAISPLTSTKLAQETLSPLVPLKVKLDQSIPVKQSSSLTAAKLESSTVVEQKRPLSTVKMSQSTGLEQKTNSSISKAAAVSLPKLIPLKSVLMQHSITAKQ
ncbi:MAG TPA: hypothetical protein DCM38_11795 [Gammaproteobacteria bacterium]|nr:hypothetical protein [Gammaproteobacteria bacterium]